jgi:sRNA-binding protein
MSTAPIDGAVTKGCEAAEEQSSSDRPTRPQKQVSSHEESWRIFRALMLRELPTILGSSQVPFVFMATSHPRPLKVGIYEDLLERFPQADRERLARWMKWWTRNPHYLQRLSLGKHRHNLDGEDAAPIEPRQAVFARALRGIPSKPISTSSPNPAPKPKRTERTLSLPVLPSKGANAETVRKVAQRQRQLERIKTVNEDAAYFMKLLQKARR